MASVRVEHLYKRFQLRKDRADSVGQLLVRMIPGRRRRPQKESFWALQDISFDMAPGVSYGIIGSNGSGKSTLLKILTRTMAPTSGMVRVDGRVSALIELGAGFHPDFTGRENVYLNASILGIPRRVIESKMDDIIDFADIRPFIDTPVKYYSSGMHARLGFSVATSVEPEILMVDEVLAVGDEAFQQRCMDRIFRMKRQGTSILLVSHDLASIERLMDRALWIDKGVMKWDGSPRDVVHAYRQSLLGEEVIPENAPQPSSGPFELAAAELKAVGSSHSAFLSGEAGILTWDVLYHGDEPRPVQVTVKLRRPDGLDIAEISSFQDEAALVLKPGLNRMRLHVDALWLATGQYELDIALHAPEGRLLQEWKPALVFSVQAMRQTAGLLYLPHHWEVNADGR